MPEEAIAEQKPPWWLFFMSWRFIVIILVGFLVLSPAIFSWEVIDNEAECNALADTSLKALCLQELDLCSQKDIKEQSACFMEMTVNKGKIFLGLWERLTVFAVIALAIMFLFVVYPRFIEHKKVSTLKLSWTDVKSNEELHAQLRYDATVAGGFLDMNVGTILRIFLLKRGEIGLGCFDRPEAKYYFFFNPAKKSKYTLLTAPILYDEMWRMLEGRSMPTSAEHIFPVYEKPLLAEIIEKYGDEIKALLPKGATQ